MVNDEIRRKAERDADETLDEILREIDDSRKNSAECRRDAESQPRTAAEPRRRPSGQRPAAAQGEGAPRRTAPRSSEDAAQRPRRSRPADVSGAQKCPAGERPQRPTGERPQHPAGQRPQRPAGQRPQRPAGQRPQHPAGERPAQPQRRRPEGDAVRTQRTAAAATAVAERTAARRSDVETVTPAKPVAPEHTAPRKARAAAKKKNPHAFGIGMLIYVIIFLLVAMFLMHQLWTFLGEYEASRPQYTIDGYVSALNNGFYSDMIRQKVEEMQVSEYENAEVISEMLNLDEMDGQRYTWLKKADTYTDENPSYYIRYGSAAIASVTLSRSGDTEHFNLPIWQAGTPVSLIEMAAEPEYTLEVTVPEGTAVTINGITVPQAEMEVCDAPITLDEAARTYAKQPTAMKVTVPGLYVTPKVQAYDVQGNLLSVAEDPDPASKQQIYIFEPKDEAVPDQELVAHVEEMMRAYINYTANKDEQVWTNLGYLDNFLVPNSKAYEILHSMAWDFNWNNPYTARVDRELTISHIKMYSDSMLTCEAYFNYQLTKNVVNDYIGTIRWTMVKVGNTWRASDFTQLSDESANTAILATPKYENEDKDDNADSTPDANGNAADPNAPADPNAVADPVV